MDLKYVHYNNHGESFYPEYKMARETVNGKVMYYDRAIYFVVT